MPTGTGSLFYNYRHFFSILLLAVVDANYCFMQQMLEQLGSLVTPVFLRIKTQEGSWNRINWESQGAGHCQMMRIGKACLS